MIVTTYHLLAVQFAVCWESVHSGPIYLEMSIRVNEQGNVNRKQRESVWHQQISQKAMP